MTIKKGKFITLEGIEGMGKSTIAQWMSHFLKTKGIPNSVTREPGGTMVAEDIRQILLNEYSEETHIETELLLLYAARIQHYKNKILPALMAGTWVICDRFYDATFAYQGGGREFSMDKIKELHRWVMGEIKPDCTILLDAPIQVGMNRIKNRAHHDRFEKENAAFFERIRQAYLNMVKKEPSRFHVIDASEPLNKVEGQIKVVLDGLSHVSA